MKQTLALAGVLACCACQPQKARVVANARAAERCYYAMHLLAQGQAKVAARCDSPHEVTFRVSGPHVLAGLRKLGPSSTGRFAAPGGRLDYVVDLAALAAQDDGFDSAAQIGASFVAPMSSVLLVPEPLSTEIEVQVQVTAQPGVDVAIGLKRSGTDNHGYTLMAHELPVATYFAFGKLESRRIQIGGAELDVTKLDGPLEQSTDEVATWIAASAKAVADFYGAFPVPRASVTVIPRPERDAVVFGKVLPESEPGVALVVGQHAPRKALYSDWILVHELFHLGFPSFFEEGKWLDEGLATYYEPIIRVRAGLYTETELWDELEKSLPQGLPAFTEHGLEGAHDFRGIYWGGALACLVADVEARKRHLARGLETGLRALREAGGNASEVWQLKDAVAVIDRSFDSPILGKITQAHAKRGSAFDLKALLADLGVRRAPSGAIALSDKAPLAEVRRAIVHQR